MSRTDAGEWVSLELAAELEQIEYMAMFMRVQRGGYLVERAGGGEENAGGRERVFVAVRSLSSGAQERYKYRQEYQKRKERYESGEEPWYIGMRLDTYLKEYEKDFYKATALKVEIERYLKLRDGCERGKGTEFSKGYAAQLGIGYKQLRRYVLRYEEACFFAERDGMEHYKTLALCKPPQKGKGMKLTEEHERILKELWAKERYHMNLQPFVALYEEFRYILTLPGSDNPTTADAVPLPLHKGGLPERTFYVPSIQTCRRFINNLEYGRSDVKTYLADGYQGFRNKGMIKGVRDIKSLRVMELIMGDAHTFDCWVSVKRDNKVIAIRPYLVAFVDTRSKCIVGWGICECPNAEVIKRVLINMMYPKKNSFCEGVPRVVYIDNGKDFTSQELTGRKRTERFDLDKNIKGFYKSVGIEYDKRALPYTPWTKAQIERFFGGLCSRFSKRFDSYTGTLTGSKTSGKRQKDIDGMLRRGELPGIEEFSAYFETYLSEYHETVHSTLKADGEANPTPRGVWESAERYFKAAPPIDYAISLIGKSCERRVYNVGIRLDNVVYSHELLGGYIDETVIIRYAEGIEGIRVYRKDNGAKICDAYPAETLNPLADVEDETLLRHLKAQKRQYRRIRDDIRELSGKPSEEPLERSLQLPEMTGERPEIVAMPEDRQYREEAEERRKTKSRKKAENCDFIKELAAEAFRNVINN